MCALSFPLMKKGQWELINFPEPMASDGIGGICVVKEFMGYKLMAKFTKYPEVKVNIKAINHNDDIIYLSDEKFYGPWAFEKGSDTFFAEISSLENKVEQEFPYVSNN